MNRTAMQCVLEVTFPVHTLIVPKLLVHTWDNINTYIYACDGRYVYYIKKNKNKSIERCSVIYNHVSDDNIKKLYLFINKRNILNNYT